MAAYCGNAQDRVILQCLFIYKKILFLAYRYFLEPVEIVQF